jgi:hypothetical protein
MQKHHQFHIRSGEPSSSSLGPMEALLGLCVGLAPEGATELDAASQALAPGCSTLLCTWPGKYHSLTRGSCSG